MKKKLVCLLLAVMLLCACAATAFAVHGNDAIGYVLRTKAQCNVRSAADADSSRVGEVHKGNEYRIYGAVKYGTNKYWYLIEAKGRMVWISSTQVSVLSNTYSSTYDLYYMGYCSVKNKSVKIHRSWSSSTARVQIAYGGDSFLITDSTVNSAGETWYQIYADGIVGWISAKAVNTYWYD